MKNATQHNKHLNALIKQLRRHDGKPLPTLDPIGRIIHGFLEWNASRKAAEAAAGRLATVMVDHNELRVSHPSEVAAVLGERYPRATERAARLHDVLQAIFEREHGVSLAALEKKAKKDVQKYLLSLPGMVPYVAAQVLLLNFGGHAIPVDDVTADLLKAQGVVEPQATVEEIAGFLERHVKAEDAMDTHRRLREWVDGHEGAGGKSRKPKAENRK